MARITQDFKEKCADYLSGALTVSEKRAFEDTLRNATGEERAYLKSMQESYNWLASDESQDTRLISKDSPTTVLPSESLLSKIMSELPAQNLKAISDENASENIRHTSASKTDFKVFYQYAAAASFILFCVSVVLGIVVLQQSGIVEEQQATITQLTDEVTAHRELFAMLKRQGVLLIGMDGLEVNPDGYANIVWDPQLQQAYMHVANLPEPPADKIYQLWMIVDASPVSAGIFDVDTATSQDFYRIDNLASGNTSAFAVTLEPEGGMPQPTGDMFLLGAI